jgi:hypothetical protein
MGDQAHDVYAPRGLIKAVGLAIVVDKEEIVGRYQPGVELLPLQQLTGSFVKPLDLSMGI